MTADKIADTRKKLLEIDKTIKELDPAIRAAAFDFLAPLYFDHAMKSDDKKAVNLKNGSDTGVDVSEDKASFFDKHEHEQPSKNLSLIVAWLYSQYGKYFITLAEINTEAAETGLTIPDRPDMTMRAAKNSGKNLFRHTDKGWELTVSGESFLRETYKVKKGNKNRPTSSQK